MLTEAAKAYLLMFVPFMPVDDNGIVHIPLGGGDIQQHPCLQGATHAVTWLEDKGGQLVREWSLVTLPPPPPRDTEEHTPPAPPPDDMRWLPRSKPRKGSARKASADETAPRGQRR